MEANKAKSLFLIISYLHFMQRDKKALLRAGRNKNRKVRGLRGLLYYLSRACFHACVGTYSLQRKFGPKMVSRLQEMTSFPEPLIACI